MHSTKRATSNKNRRTSFLFMIVLMLIMLTLSSCSLLNASGGSGRTNSMTHDQRTDTPPTPDNRNGANTDPTATGDHNDPSSDVGEGGTNTTDTNVQRTTGEEGATGDPYIDKYPWLADLPEEERQEIIDNILSYPLIKAIDLKSMQFPTTFDEYHRFTRMFPKEYRLKAYDQAELAKHVSLFPIAPEYFPAFFGNNGDYNIKTFVKKPMPDGSNPTEKVITARLEGAMDIQALGWIAFFGPLLPIMPYPDEIYASFIKPELPAANLNDPDYQNVQFKGRVNVEIILDASGSMNEDIGGRSKMEAAKDAIKKFVSELPKGVNVSLRAFGHRPAADKNASCTQSELLYPLSPYNDNSFQSALNEVKATGWTPLALNIEKTLDDFQGLSGETNTNIVLIVSDGAESCGGDPVRAAEKLKQSDIQPFFHIIGFRTDAEGMKQLARIQEAVGGIYYEATRLEEIEQELGRLKKWTESWETWRKQALNTLGSKREEMKKTYYEKFAEVDRLIEKGVFGVLDGYQNRLIKALKSEGKIDSDYLFSYSPNIDYSSRQLWTDVINKNVVPYAVDRIKAKLQTVPGNDAIRSVDQIIAMREQYHKIILRAIDKNFEGIYEDIERTATEKTQ